MTYKTGKERNSTFPWVLFLVVIITSLVVMSGLSLNKIREGQPGFLTNLWLKDAKANSDPILAENPAALEIR